MLNLLSKISITMTMAYPLVAYITLWLEQPIFIIGYLMLILFLLSIEKSLKQHWFFSGLLLSSLALLFYLIQQPYIEYLHFLPPILILFSFFIFFSQSLLKGKTPLISRYAILLGDKLEERHLRYNRILTFVWAIFFLIMLSTSILLALFSSADIWSLFTYVISYILLTSFFIIEFLYRKHYFAGEIEVGFFQFMSKVIKIRPKNLHKKQ